MLNLNLYSFDRQSGCSRERLEFKVFPSDDAGFLPRLSRGEGRSIGRAWVTLHWLGMYAEVSWPRPDLLEMWRQECAKRMGMAEQRYDA